MLIAFEGLDQSGKETQARLLGERLAREGRRVQALSFPEYETPIGREIRQALDGARTFTPDVMQLLYVANRLEFKPQIDQWIADGHAVVCDRYLASSIAYGEAQGLDPAWLSEIQRSLPPPTLTVFLDIAPETAVRRKSTGRDKYERDMELLGRVRLSYQRQAKAADWCRVDAEGSKEDVARSVEAAVMGKL